MQTIRQAIANALRGLPIKFDEQAIAAIERKVLDRSPQNPAGYAYMTARNWAVDRIREQARQTRQKAAELIVAENERLERERAERCRKEYDNIVFYILPNLHPAQQKQVVIVRLAAFDGLSDDDCAKRFPGTTKDQRYQWKCRGVRLISARVSEELEKFLEECKWKR